MLAQITARIKTSIVQLEAWWRSEQSTIAGFVSIATGLFSGETARALHTLGLAESLIQKIAAALVVIGALLVTPKNRNTDAG